MIQNKCSERPRWVTMMVPVLRYQIKVPKKISKLVYQLNIRGFKTGEITWGDPILIKLHSHNDFIEKVKQSGRHEKREVRDFYKFLIAEIDFKLNIHNYQAGPHEPVELSLVLPHSKIKKFQQLFYDGFIKNTDTEKKMVNRYVKQTLDDQESEDEVAYQVITKDKPQNKMLTTSLC